MDQENSSSNSPAQDKTKEDEKEDPACKSGAIKKSCPDCKHKVPTACKACPCGYSYRRALQEKGKVNATTAPKAATNKVRRAARLKRPNFYSAVEYSSPTKKSRNGETSSPRGQRTTRGRKRHAINGDRKKSDAKTENVEDVGDNASSIDDDISSTAREDKDSLTLDDMYNRFSAYKLRQFSVILSDINHKLSVHSFRPK